MKDEKKSASEMQPYFQQATAVAVPLNKLKPLKRLTLEALSIAKIGELVCQCTSELREETMPSKFHESGHAIAACVDVIDLMRGEEFMLICNTVLASALRRVEGPITGRYFAIKCGAIVAGKTYRKVDVMEVWLEK